MANVRVTPQAEADLDAAVEYFKRVAPDYAAVFEADLLVKLDRLASFPRLGRRVPEVGDDAIR